MAEEEEAAIRWSGHARAHESHDKIHLLEHAHEQELSRNEERRLQAAAEAHKADHIASSDALRVALSSVRELADLHTVAHARDHLAHEQRHVDQQTAIALADAAMDKRLEGLNEFREQLREQARSLASAEKVDALQVLMNDRYETNRQRIEILEKGDVKHEGRGIGQTATIAAIVLTISVVGTVLGIIIVVANIVTGTS